MVVLTETVVIPGLSGILSETLFIAAAGFLGALFTHYSKERIQFKVPISSFGAIKHKISNMIIKTFSCESICYRAGNDIENKISEFENSGLSKNESELKAIELFSVECAISKISVLSELQKNINSDRPC